MNMKRTLRNLPARGSQKSRFRNAFCMQNRAFCAPAISQKISCETSSKIQNSFRSQSARILPQTLTAPDLSYSILTNTHLFSAFWVNKSSYFGSFPTKLLYTMYTYIYIYVCIYMLKIYIYTCICKYIHIYIYM